MSNIIKAYNLAAKAHLNQKRNDGEDYINHPIRVALRCIESISADYDLWSDIPEVISRDVQVALMHDVVENTSVTIGDIINEGFSAYVVDLLITLTRSKNITYSQYISDIIWGNSYPVSACTIKIADIADNYPTATDSMKKRYDKALNKLNEYMGSDLTVL